MWMGLEELEDELTPLLAQEMSEESEMDKL
jgi:hypothetical protein